MSETRQSSRALGRAAVGAVLALGLVLAAYRTEEADLFWHLKTGEWIVAHRAVPRVDMFSFSREGEPWIDSQWLFQAALYGSFSGLGAAGPTVLRMVSITLVLVFLFLAAPRGLDLSLLGAAGLLFLGAVNVRLVCRPELLTYICMAAELWCLERMRAGRRGFVIGLPAVQAVFANVEGLWPIGIAIAGAYLLDAAAKVKRPWSLAGAGELRPWFLAAGLVTAASLVQAYGVSGALFPLTLLKEVLVSGTEQKQLILEFQPIFYPSWSPWLFVPFLAFAAAAAGSALLSGRALRPGLFLLGLAFIYLAVTACRNTGIASVFLMQVLTVHLEVLARTRPGWFRSGPARRLPGVLTLGLALFLGFLSAAPATRFWDHTGRKPGFGIALDGKHYPVQAAAFLHSIGYRGNIINGMELGGYLIWAGWPRWKVMADNRFELGGEEAIRYYKSVYTNLDQMARVSREHDAAAVVMSYRQPYSDVFLALLQDRRWALVHVDYTGGVFLRRGPEWDETISQDEIKDPFRSEVSPYSGPAAPWLSGPGASGIRP